jgi:hypothetical protein
LRRHLQAMAPHRGRSGLPSPLAPLALLSRVAFFAQ